MASNDHCDSSGDDFVLIDNPATIDPAEDVYGKTPLERGYVNILKEQPKKKAEQEEEMVRIEGFLPMRPSAFTEAIKQALLKVAGPAPVQAAQGEASKPHATLIKNLTVMLECFFHFSSVYPKIGMFNMYALVGKACKLVDTNDFVILQQYVGSVIGTLQDARAPFRRWGEDQGEYGGASVSGVEDPDAQALVLLMDRYMDFEADDPDEIDKHWCNDQAVQRLWVEWKIMISTRLMNVSDGNAETASNPTGDASGAEGADLLVAGSLAATKLKAALDCLQARRVSSGLTPGEQRMVERVSRYATRWAAQINDLPMSAPSSD